MIDSILDVVHQTAQSLHNNGLMITKTMRKFDELCLPVVREYSPQQIKNIRLRNSSSQSIFAAYLNISISTIQKWESGNKKPNGPSLKLLNLVDEKGIEILI